MMDGYEKKGASGQEKGKNILIIVLAILVVLSGIRLFADHKEKQQKTGEILLLSEENTDLNLRLDSITYQLDLRIQEIQRLGGSIDSLLVIKDQLLQARTNDKNRTIEEIDRLNREIDRYKRVLVAKDNDIATLKRMNEQLYSENKDLKTSKAEIEDEVVKLNIKTEQLEQKVSIAGRLRAENIVIAAVNARGREREGEFRNRQLEKLKVSFTLAENELAPLGTKDIYLQILSPTNQVIFDVAKGSGTFTVDGREEFYTARQDILFDNSQQRLTYFYEKGSDYVKGRHQIRVFADGVVIGIENFDVK
ncbi:hypothetical protein ADIS_1185 [Lunatimonas lonarensis]|uniref:Chromosome segregation protein SMC n=1 Tax=Lunatimonas lonarensis TaxID=1232681 RepID=R7ZW58_9BACT|nr:hypothetical protein [Lunatimonas lonarensis]EON78322.1 hypothetical protein ADIS_1185 [Lunatimonas lonarensis]